ncbi:SH3 domain-containing protein [Streptomyces sp. NPDC051172]|uniref:SH3 domain-containing protein n=1 Tax=Streptomyces sp. NPDC051172 TaxID=3155796 RepID=UPI00342FBAE5
MIRRSLRSGLVAAFAVVAVFPVAAVASAGPAPQQAHALNSTPPQISVPAWQPAPTPSTLPAKPKAPKAPKCHHGRHHAKGRAARHHNHHRHIHSVRHIVRNHTRGYVATHRLPLNVRSGPGTGYRVVGSRAVGSSVAITCKVRGSGVRGNHRWYRLAHHGGWVSARYVHNLGTVRWC